MLTVREDVVQNETSQRSIDSFLFIAHCNCMLTIWFVIKKKSYRLSER